MTTGRAKPIPNGFEFYILQSSAWPSFSVSLFLGDEILVPDILDLEDVVGHVTLRHAAVVDDNFRGRLRSGDPDDSLAPPAHFHAFTHLATIEADSDRYLGADPAEVLNGHGHKVIALRGLARIGRLDAEVRQPAI